MEPIDTQNKYILKMLQEGRRITPMDAMAEIGCMRLGARIFDLRRMGHDIETIECESRSRYGHKVRYASYQLRKREIA